MLAPEQNRLLTQVGPGTPMGRLVRRYWIPALLARQLPHPDCDPVRVTLMGERLVAFRDSQGRVGLLDERCPHRTASLYFGRNEDFGLRCVYHGWKFDIHGTCLDTPNERDGGKLRDRVRATAYPCVERGELVWTYMGPAELKPDFPALEWTQLPPSHRVVTRRIQDCNWLQAMEGGFDGTHLSFLHKGDLSRDFPLPSHYEFMHVPAGFICGYGRDEDGTTLWSSDTFLMPFHKLIATALPGAHAWVPIDDETTMLYSIDYDPAKPLAEDVRAAHLSGTLIHSENEAGSDRMAQNRANDYRIDRALQKSGTSFTGIRGVGVQDSAVQESMGPIADRSREHLGAADLGIVQLRRYLLRAVEDHRAGRALPAQSAESYRLRPLYLTTPQGLAFKDVIARHLGGEAAEGLTALPA